MLGSIINKLNSNNTKKIIFKNYFVLLIKAINKAIIKNNNSGNIAKNDF